MKPTWKAKLLHDDAAKSCGKCSWAIVSGIPCSSSGGNNYGCTECGLIWSQETEGILTSLGASYSIKVPLDENGDVIRDADEPVYRLIYTHPEFQH